MFQLINTQTNEIAFIGKTPTECRSYAIKKKLFTVERGKHFQHLIAGYWDIQRVK